MVVIVTLQGSVGKEAVVGGERGGGGRKGVCVGVGVWAGGERPVESERRVSEGRGRW